MKMSILHRFPERPTRLSYCGALAFILLLAGVAMSPSARADVIEVPGDQPTIQAAIDIAADGDVIEIAAGVYSPASTIDTLGKAVTLRGEVDEDGMSLVSIDGRNEIRLVQCFSGEGNDTVFEHLVFTAGFVSGRVKGGGFACFQSSPTLKSCRFVENVAGYGGGVSCLYASPVLIGCVFEENIARDEVRGGGGGFYCGESSSPILENCLFLRNRGEASRASGGGFFQDSQIGDGIATLNGCTFEGNQVIGSFGRGGGMCCAGIGASTLVGCVFEANQVNGFAARGGGMHCDRVGSSLTECVFRGNASADEGGGMYCDQASPNIVDCVFQENAAVDVGGGMHCDGSSSPVLTGTTLCENAPDQVYGGFTDDGSNCLAFSCVDTDEDGTPDKCGGGTPTILFVPSEAFPTIASAIAAAASGDIVEIAGGVHFPDDTISLQGKSITLRGSVDADGVPITIIDGQSSKRVFQCTAGEDGDTRFENLVITGGDEIRGGGMYCVQSSPTLVGVVFRENRGWDGTLYCDSNSNPMLIGCAFVENHMTDGGGMYVALGSRPVLVDCVFRGNSAGDFGGGIYLDQYGAATISNCTFQDNTADREGGAIRSRADHGVEIDGSIFCGNTQGCILGSWIDAGGNCLLNVCQDGDGDGLPDCSGTGTELQIEFPADYSTIALAIDAAAPGAVIEIASGIHAVESTIDTLGKPITLRGSVDADGKPTAIFDGEGERRVLQCVTGEGGDTVFENLVITGGEFRTGAGVFTNASSPTFDNCAFTANSSEQRGGGVYSVGGGPILNDCLIDLNTARVGAGVCCEDSSMILSECTFSENAVASGPDYEGVGGGMYCYGGASKGLDSPTLTGCVFRRNSADGPTQGNGGGIYAYRCDPTLNDCLFEANSAGYLGGAVLLYQGEAIVSGCVFRANSAEFAGGLACYVDVPADLPSSSDPVLTGCHFLENVAGTAGGGLYCWPEPTTTLVENIVCGNTPDQIGGLFTDDGGNCVQEVCIDCGLADCPTDLDDDGVTDGIDFGLLLVAWGECRDCAADFNDDGVVDGEDLAMILAAWGPCE